MNPQLLRFDGTLQRDPAIDAWMKQHEGPLSALAPRLISAAYPDIKARVENI